jgi:hypothetical protein
MVDPAPLAPDELDRIEDALEWLESAEALDDASPRVRDRLSAYREILVASREALPLEDVPAGLLDGVIAQARASAGAATPVVAPAAEASRPSAWARFRRSFLVPTLALAGTAALVLWIARPDPHAAGIDRAEIAQSSAPAGDAAARGRATPAEASAPTSVPPAGADADAAVTDKGGDSPAAATPAPEPAANAPGGLLRLDDAREQQNKPAEEIGDLGKQAKLPETKGPQSADVPGWDLIEKADSARKGGDCRSARDVYNYATEDEDPAVRARAFAGLGLCDQAAGNSDAAQENFAKARDEDASIDTLIDRENAKPYRSSTKAKPSSKRKAKSRSSASKDDPFSGL